MNDYSQAHEAARLYWRGYTVSEIARMLDRAQSTVNSWKKAHRWDEATVARKCEAHIEARYCQLLAKENKSASDLNEIEALSKQMERMARIRKYSAGGNEGDLNPKLRERRKGKKKKPEASNYLSDDDIAKCKALFREKCFAYQWDCWGHHGVHPVRFYLKSRQIGFTLYFSWEALIDALDSGKNKIFISASKNQAKVFRRNIINFVREACGVELKGEVITLGHNGAEFHFLGTNKNTAQSYSGDLYIDEAFWIPNFSDIEHVASGMAVLDDRRITYFSTPSSVTHEAYPLWTGEHFNEDRPKADHIELCVTHKVLRDGLLCEDGIFRQMVTVEDAINKGNTMITLERLRLKFAPSKWPNLFLCEFVNDTDSIFKLSELQRCMVDRDLWEDYNPFLARPYGDKPVWLGYDPSDSGDDASLVVVAPPLEPGGKYRLLEKMSWQGMDFDYQANQIERFTRMYNVQHIAVDATGIGHGLYQLVRKFYPAAQKVMYNIDVKTEMVLIAKQLVNKNRIEFDQSWTDLVHAFMTIYQDSTASGSSVTYKAQRTKKTGHADLAWATMHALLKQGVVAVDEIGDEPTGSAEMF